MSWILRLFGSHIMMSILIVVSYYSIEVCKIHSWLAMAEASEAESASGPPTMLEIPVAFVAGSEI